MSVNKKYYYIKLKDNYFEQDNIKVLEAVPNGHIYSLIIVKLYLKATKYGGQLKMTESIPYDPKKIDILASVLNHDVAHVKEAIKLSSELGIISIFDTGEIWMSEIQNFIGHSSSEADRKRVYRNHIKEQETLKVGHLSDVRPPEKELEKEKEKELDKNGYLIDFSKWTNEDLQNNIKLVAEKKPEYTKEMLINFYKYWIAPNKKGIEIFKKERSWSTASRLATWFNNQKK